MKFFFTLVLMASSTVFAETIKDRIFAVEDGMVKFENGRVAFLDSSSFDLKKNEVITATIDEKSTLISVEKDYKETFKNASFDFDSIQNQIYSSSRDFFEPTVIKGGMQEAWNIFNRSNPYYKRISECTDRAHVWAHDEFKKNGTKSIKAFVLFTASYINSVRFKW